MGGVKLRHFLCAFARERDKKAQAHNRHQHHIAFQQDRHGCDRHRAGVVFNQHNPMLAQRHRTDIQRQMHRYEYSEVFRIRFKGVFEGDLEYPRKKRRRRR